MFRVIVFFHFQNGSHNHFHQAWPSFKQSVVNNFPEQIRKLTSIQDDSKRGFELHDPGLTDLGFQQCEELAKFLQGLPLAWDIELIVSSPLRRAVQTTEKALGWVKDGISRLIRAEWQETSAAPSCTGTNASTMAKKCPNFDWSEAITDEVYPAKTGLYAPSKDALTRRGIEARRWLRGRQEIVIAVVSHNGFLWDYVCNTRFGNANCRIFTFAEGYEEIDRKLVEWELTKSEPRGLGKDPKGWRLFGHSDCVNAIIFSPDGKQLASASDDNTVRLWDAAIGATLQTLEGHSGRVNGVAFSPDGRQLTSTSDDETVKLWDAATGTTLQTLKGHSGRVNAVAFSPDGKLASASDDKTVRLWDTATGATLQTLKGHQDPVNTVAFSPDGKQLASASDDETVRLWDATTGAALQTLKGHQDPVNTVAFSPDGKQLASASNDETVGLWDATTGAALQTLGAHWDSVNAVTFSPDGKRLASASDDGTVRLWDTATGATLQMLEGHSGAVNAVAFSPGGEQMASASSDKTVKLWKAIQVESMLRNAAHRLV
jgi:WD40 repeat protein/broad specificity phosphatase PhoE